MYIMMEGVKIKLKKKGRKVLLRLKERTASQPTNQTRQLGDPGFLSVFR